MKVSNRFGIYIASIFYSITYLYCSNGPDDSNIVYFNTIETHEIKTRGDIQYQIVEKEGLYKLNLNGEAESSIVFPIAESCRDQSKKLGIIMDVQNLSEHALHVLCRVNGKLWIDGAVILEPHESGQLKVYFKRNDNEIPPEVSRLLFNMNGLPGGFMWIWETFKTSQMDYLEVLLNGNKYGNEVQISNIRTFGNFKFPPVDSLRTGFFPCVDEFGQYVHRDWPNKVNSISDLNQNRETEEKFISQQPRPDNWNEYGGWLNGPTFETTGHFRVEKYQGKWWFVDPDGKLFWSHGIDVVGPNTATPITDREHYFTDLPRQNDPVFGQFFSKRYREPPREYYRTHTPYDFYDFGATNLLKKYGNNWKAIFPAITGKRLQSWGINSIGSWSDPQIYRQAKIPYTKIFHTNSVRRIEGSKGYWSKFPDPFNPDFKEELRKAITTEAKASANDPFCIGYFVDNELSWHYDTTLAVATLKSPDDQPAKKVFVHELRQKYTAIERLNQVWLSDYGSWQDILSNQTHEINSGAVQDLKQFNKKIAERYFSICRNEIKRAASNKLYLGCRFDFHFYPYYPDEKTDCNWLVKIASRYCDVVSFNRYRFSVKNLVPSEGIDKPLLVGEFHFGALDRGGFHTGLRTVSNQEERSKAYQYFVSGALKNPFVIGAHWFQYRDQPISGRFDGENYQIGFVDICDTPYPELIKASLQIGTDMYIIRSASH